MLLTEEQRAIRDTARAFAQAEIAPHAAAWERDGGAPRNLYRRMGDVGLMGVCVPPEHGGAGADFVSYVLAMEEIAAADCGVANVMAANNSPVAAAVAQHGTPFQKGAYLAKLARGELIGAILLTEPHTGSDAAAIRTRARRRTDGGGWTIDGAKSFITAGSTADLAMIVAVTDPEAGKRAITCFLCPTDRPGYRVVRKESKLGHRNNDTCQIALDGLEAGHRDVLGEARGRAPDCPRPPLGGAHRGGRPGGGDGAGGPRGGARLRARARGVRQTHHRAPGGRVPGSPKWRPRSKWRARCTSTQRPSRRPARTPSARRPWPSSSPRRWPSGSARARSRSTAGTAT